MWNKLKFWGKSDHTKTIVELNSPIVVNSETTESFGIRIIEGEFAPLVEKGVAVPVEKKYIFSTWADNQDQIRLIFYRGNNNKAESNTYLAEYQIINIPLEPAGEPQVQLTVGVNNQEIWISAKNLKTNKYFDITCLDSNVPSELI